MNIAILGYGVVGKGVYKLAVENGMNVSHILMRDIDELTMDCMTSCYDDIINDSAVDCVVECIGGLEPAHSYVLKALKSGKNVVSSNKKMLAHYLDELADESKTNNVSLLFSAACGGGIPWLKELNSVAAAEKVNSIMGIMNGTSNYILDKMNCEDQNFDVALKKAQDLGFAESDPSDDIDGIDTANKVILSSVIAFHKLYSLENMFVRGIRNFSDTDMKYCKNNGYKCVLMGKASDRYAYVIPSFVRTDSVFASISLNNNCFSLNSCNLGSQYYIGQGAGSLPTASNVIRDIISLDKPYPVIIEEKADYDYEVSKNIYYLRTSFNICADEIRKAGDSLYLTEPISISRLKEIIKDMEDVFVAEVLDDQGM